MGTQIVRRCAALPVVGRTVVRGGDEAGVLGIGDRVLAHLEGRHEDVVLRFLTAECIFVTGIAAHAQGSRGDRHHLFQVTRVAEGGQDGRSFGPFACVQAVVGDEVGQMAA
ncbi:MAG: hypothetical protein R2838_04320 [Caldilineaceae bacterium]